MSSHDDLNAEQERAWQEWIALRDRALETGDIADGIASGKALGRFHYLFVKPSHGTPRLREVQS